MAGCSNACRANTDWLVVTLAGMWLDIWTTCSWLEKSSASSFPALTSRWPPAPVESSGSSIFFMPRSATRASLFQMFKCTRAVSSSLSSAAPFLLFAPDPLFSPLAERLQRKVMAKMVARARSAPPPLPRQPVAATLTMTTQAEPREAPSGTLDRPSRATSRALPHFKLFSVKPK